MATNPSAIRGYTSRHSDGTPALEFFNTATGHAFTWTGDRSDPIEVSAGGYGEPVTCLIQLSAAPVPKNLVDALAWFRDVAAEWVAWLTEYGDLDNCLDLPTRTEFDTASSASRQHWIETGIYMLMEADR